MSKVTYVGLDVHMKFTVAVRRMPGGVERPVVVPTTAEGMSRLVEMIDRRDARAAYQASGAGWEVYDWLGALGWKVSVLAPTHLPHPRRARKTKTDLRDARKLLEVLMGHGELGTELPAVWAPDERTRQDRELVRRRLKLGEKIAAKRKTTLNRCALKAAGGVDRPIPRVLGPVGECDPPQGGRVA